MSIAPNEAFKARSYDFADPNAQDYSLIELSHPESVELNSFGEGWGFTRKDLGVAVAAAVTVAGLS